MPGRVYSIDPRKKVWPLTAQPKPLAQWEQILRAKAERAYRIPKSPNHPWDHTLRVVSNAARIAQEAWPNRPELIKLVKIAAYLHDIGRGDESGGPDHAAAGAEIADRDFLKSLGLLQIEEETILFAIAHHGDYHAPNGRVPVTFNYPEIEGQGLIEEVIAALWDADRLELTRLHPVLAEYLSTDQAKKMLPEFNARWAELLPPVIDPPLTHGSRTRTRIEDLSSQAAVIERLEKGETVVAYRAVKKDRAVLPEGTELKLPFIITTDEEPVEKTIEMLIKRDYPHYPTRHKAVFVFTSKHQALHWGMVVFRVSLSLKKPTELGKDPSLPLPACWLDRDGYVEARNISQIMMMAASVGGLEYSPVHYTTDIYQCIQKYLGTEASHDTLNSEIFIDPFQVEVRGEAPLSPEEHRDLLLGELFTPQIDTLETVLNALRLKLSPEHPFWQFYGGYELVCQEAVRHFISIKIQALKTILEEVSGKFDYSANDLSMEDGKNGPRITLQQARIISEVLDQIKTDGRFDNIKHEEAEELLRKVDAVVQRNGHKIFLRELNSPQLSYKHFEALVVSYRKACKIAGVDLDERVLFQRQKDVARGVFLDMINELQTVVRRRRWVALKEAIETLKSAGVLDASLNERFTDEAKRLTDPASLDYAGRIASQELEKCIALLMS